MFRGVPMLVIIVLFRIDNPTSVAYYGHLVAASCGGYLMRHLVEYPAMASMHVSFISGFMHWCHGGIT